MYRQMVSSSSRIWGLCSDHPGGGTSVAAGSIIRTEPAAGSQVAAGSTVVVYVSRPQVNTTARYLP